MIKHSRSNDTMSEWMTERQMNEQTQNSVPRVNKKIDKNGLTGVQLFPHVKLK